ncbi:hypothetical protein ACJX0J_030358, partial [Zea mays]
NDFMNCLWAHRRPKVYIKVFEHEDITNARTKRVKKRQEPSMETLSKLTIFLLPTIAHIKSTFIEFIDRSMVIFLPPLVSRLSCMWHSTNYFVPNMFNTFNSSPCPRGKGTCMMMIWIHNLLKCDYVGANILIIRLAHYLKSTNYFATPTHSFDKRISLNIHINSNTMHQLIGVNLSQMGLHFHHNVTVNAIGPTFSLLIMGYVTNDTHDLDCNKAKHTAAVVCNNLLSSIGFEEN